jgi:hypothetical protein
MNWDQVGGTGEQFPQSSSEAGSTKPSQEGIGDLWCRLMHTEPMWPSHGQYECRTCGRRFQVCWEHQSTVTPNAMVWPLETPTPVSVAAGRL